MKKKHHDTVDKYSSEQQFRKSDAIGFIVGAILLMLVGLTAGWQAVFQQSDEILIDLKFSTDCIIQHLTKVATVL